MKKNPGNSISAKLSRQTGRQGWFGCARHWEHSEIQFSLPIRLCLFCAATQFFIFSTNLDNTNLAYDIGIGNLPPDFWERPPNSIAYPIGLPIAPPNHLSTKTHPKRMYHAGEKLLKLNEINCCIKDTYVFILISI